MKTTKKVLSIVLSVMLLVGMVVVGVNADTTMVYEKAGSKLVYSATADKTTTDKDGYILVQPGDEVTVSVYMQANYYIGTTGSEIFVWSTNFFDEVSLEDDISRHNFINCYTAANNKLIAEGTAQLGGNYAKGGYVGYLYGRGYKDNQPGPFDASTPVLAYQFKFTVASTTADGATAEFVMPEPCSATVATNSRMRQIFAAVNNSASDYGSSSLASQYPETIDLSATLLKFKVGTAATLGEIKSVNAAPTIIGDTSVVSIDVTGSPESLRVVTPGAETTFTRDDATIQTTTDGEEWVIEVVAESASTACTVYADYGAAGETEGTDFTITGVEYCSYALLENAVNNCSELDAQEEYYDPTDLATWKSALAEAQALLADKETDPLQKSDENQAKLDNAAKALTDAYDALVEKYVSTAPITEALNATANPEYPSDVYTTDSWNAYVQAKEAAEDALITFDGAPDTADNQAEVKRIADALTAAYNGLATNKVDLADLEKAVNVDCANPAYEEEFYAADAWSEYQVALSAATKGLTDYADAVNTAANQAAVAKLASDLRTAYAALVPQFVNLEELNKAIEDCHALDNSPEWYDETELATWQAALDAAHAGMETYADEADTQANRDAVAKLASDLRTAFNELDPRSVDVSDLEKAIAESAPAYGEEYYDAAAWSAFQAALAEGNAVLEMKDNMPDTAENRKTVADAAAAVRATFAKLVPQFISYKALEDAVAAYGTTPEAAEDYTAETYDPYAAALARANEMLKNRNDEAPASDTNLAAQIAAAAEELESTFNKLELVPVVTIITDVTSGQKYYKVGDTVNFNYLCSVTNVTKIQLVYENGTTITYHRNHASVTVTDNGDGTETWTIATKIYYDEARVSAKAKLGKVWEEKGYKYDVKTSTDEDFSIKSAEVLLNDVVVSEFLTTDTAVIKVVAGPNTLRIRLVDKALGTTSTYGRTKGYQETNGNWVWLITRSSAAGEYGYDVYSAGGTNKLTDSGVDLYYTVKAPVIVNGPSTGNDADIVVSATVAKARLLRDAQQTVTIVTDKNAKGVRVVDQNGVVQGYNKDTASVTDNGDGTITWTVTYKCILASSYTCEVVALYGNQWMSNGTTVAYRVFY